ncbi:hypothetical protein B1222_21860 [Paenibacillus larvae subsp. pulvifaciens]|uniref:hypothetical protein n=1 Tax=Paenibacillus larvae TaxID=1464 RepID=UPI0009C20F61|nr:hypothetical protein [Paenibacillus larvae]AQT86441.1 hypothetical protein B1222_21860 [Paenibacillus larvae subsp. pulvifaciens]
MSGLRERLARMRHGSAAAGKPAPVPIAAPGAEWEAIGAEIAFGIGAPSCCEGAYTPPVPSMGTAALTGLWRKPFT